MELRPPPGSAGRPHPIRWTPVKPEYVYLLLIKALPRLRRVGRFLALAGILLLFAKSGLLLARDPCRGVADNRDYWRVARPAGIKVERQKRGGAYVVCSYPIGESKLASGFSSSALLARLGSHFDWGLDVPPGRFDLRQIGLLYWLFSVVLVIGAVLLGLPVFLALLFAWVLADPGFVLFFNSLYADPTLIVALTGLAALMPLASFERVREDPGSRRHRFLLILLWMLASAASSSKLQFSPFALALAAAYGVAAWAYRKRPSTNQMLFLIALTIAGLAAPLHFFRGSGTRFLDANNYNAVYGGIARVASHRDRSLEFLGIPPEYRSRSTKDYFAAGVRQGDQGVVRSLRHLSRLRLAWTYLRDPGALFRTATAIEGIFQKVRTHPRGTYTQLESPGRTRADRTLEPYSFWRAKLLRSLPSQFVWMVLVITTSVLVVRGARRSWNPICTLLLFLTIWVTSQMAVAILGEGFVNLHQHLVGARLGFDLMLVTLLFLTLAAASRRLTHTGHSPVGPA